MLYFSISRRILWAEFLGTFRKYIEEFRILIIFHIFQLNERIIKQKFYYVLKFICHFVKKKKKKKFVHDSSILWDYSIALSPVISCLRSYYFNAKKITLEKPKNVVSGKRWTSVIDIEQQKGKSGIDYRWLMLEITGVASPPFFICYFNAKRDLVFFRAMRKEI